MISSTPNKKEETPHCERAQKYIGQTGRRPYIWWCVCSLDVVRSTSYHIKRQRYGRLPVNHRQIKKPQPPAAHEVREC